MNHLSMILALLCLCLLYAGEARAATFYVATNGDDSWSGKIASPNGQKTDGPFATLSRARDAVRELKKSGLNEPVSVQVRGGEYFLEKTLLLGPQDSGKRNCPITYEAYPSEKPILSGGRIVTGWKPYKGKILQADLPGAKGGKLWTRQLFLNGERQPRARYPNIDPKNPLYSNWLFPEAKADEYEQRTIKFRPGTFPRRWAKPNQGEVNIYPNGWLDNTIPIKSINEQYRTITLEREITQFDRSPWWFSDWLCINPDCRFIVENLLEELDQPGEWCLDTEEGRLYFWPPDGTLKATDQIVVPVIDCLIDLRGTSCVNICGLTFTETTGGDDYHRIGGEGYGAMFLQQGLKYVGEALHMKDTCRCGILDNRFYAVGGNAVYLEFQNARNTISGNEIAYAGANGIALLGSRDKLPEFNTIEDNHIHHCGRLNRYVAGVFSTVSDGNLIAHNNIHDMPHHAINLGSNGHGRNIIEYNDIRNVCLELHDNGAINSWGDVPGPKTEREWERSGHIIRYNLIVSPVGCGVSGGKLIVPNKEGSRGIYLDDCTSNCVVYGNTIVGAGIGVDVHNGRHHVIENNIIVNCDYGELYHDDQSNRLGTSIMKGFMKANWSRRNIIYSNVPGTKMYRMHNAWTDEVIADSDYNLMFASGGEPMIEFTSEHKDITLSQWKSMGYDEHTVVADPLFVDPDSGDYRLKPESPALKLGFQPVDAKQIGIRAERGNE